MKMNITVECTPEEARAFLGLPDVSPINETLVASVKQRIEQNVELVSPEFYLKQWYSMGGQASESFMQLMGAGARARECSPRRGHPSLTGLARPRVAPRARSPGRIPARPCGHCDADRHGRIRRRHRAPTPPRRRSTGGARG